MAYRFDGAGDFIRFAAGAWAGDSPRPGTYAVLFKRNGSVGAWQAILCVRTSAGSDRLDLIELNTSDDWGFWNGTGGGGTSGDLSGSVVADVTSTTQWALVVLTWAISGTTNTVRYHWKVGEGGAWNHGSIADTAGAGPTFAATDEWIIGETGGGSDDLNADVTIWGAKSGQALSDAQVESTFAAAFDGPGAWDAYFAGANTVCHGFDGTGTRTDRTGNSGNETTRSSGLGAALVADPPGWSWSAGGVTGAAAQTLPGLTQDAAGAARAEGPVAQTLPPLGQAGDGALAVVGSTAQTLPGFTQDAAGEATVSGEAAGILPALAQDASGMVGSEAVTGAVSQQLPPIAQAATAAATVEGDVANSLPALTQDAAGLVEVEGVAGPINQTLLPLGQNATGNLAVNGTSTQQLPAFTQGVDASTTVTGTASSSLGALTSSSTGRLKVRGEGASILGALEQLATGTVPASGEIASTLPAITSTMTGRVGRRIARLELAATEAHTLTLAARLSHALALDAGANDLTLSGSLDTTMELEAGT